MGLVFTLLLIILVGGLLWLVNRYTENGTVPLDEAWRKTTVWLSAAGMAFGQFFADLLAMLAENWTAIQGQYAELFTNDALGPFLQALSGVFFFWRMKGQRPRLKLPPISGDDTAAPSA